MESRLRQYLRLFHSTTVSPVLWARLLQQFGSLSRLLAEPDETFLPAGLPEFEQLRAVAAGPDSTEVERSLRWSEAADHTLLCYEDPDYPTLLKEIAAPPPLLFVRGQLSCLRAPQLALVGSRAATSYGLRTARWLAYELGAAGWLICSGLARGIDTCAHEGALAAGGGTIAVIGTGADRLYPPGNERLAEAIVDSGALVSEFPLGTPPLPPNFPRRNRIMSGLSLGTVVIEAALKSGSLITARLALEQNREVFAVPGLISNPAAAGCHRLLREGAKLVATPTDILEEFAATPYKEGTIAEAELPQAGTDGRRPGAESSRAIETVSGKVSGKGIEPGKAGGSGQATGRGNNPATPGSPEPSTVQCNTSHGAVVMALIGNHGCELQGLLGATGLDHQRLLAVLMELEMAGQITSRGGRYYAGAD